MTVTVTAKSGPVPGGECVIVGPRLQTGATCHPPFDAREETHELQRFVAPSSGDATGLLMRLSVMPAMLCPAEDEPLILQPPNERCRGTLMRPLMKLVGEHTHPAQAQAKHPKSTTPRSAVQQEQHRHEDRNLKKGDITVAIDEVTSEEVVRIEVMNAEWAQQAPPENGHGLVAPGIGEPMDQS